MLYDRAGEIKQRQPAFGLVPPILHRGNDKYKDKIAVLRALRQNPTLKPLLPLAPAPATNLLHPKRLLLPGRLHHGQFPRLHQHLNQPANIISILDKLDQNNTNQDATELLRDSGGLDVYFGRHQE